MMDHLIKMSASFENSSSLRKFQSSRSGLIRALGTAKIMINVKIGIIQATVTCIEVVNSYWSLIALSAFMRRMYSSVSSSSITPRGPPVFLHQSYTLS